MVEQFAQQWTAKYRKKNVPGVANHKRPQSMQVALSLKVVRTRQKQNNSPPMLISMVLLANTVNVAFIAFTFFCANGERMEDVRLKGDRRRIQQR